MASLIRAPRLGRHPHVLRTPRGGGSKVAAVEATPSAGAEAPATASPAEAAAPTVDPEIAARLAEAELQAADAKAELDELRGDLEAQRERARSAGFDEGHAQGLEQARAALREKVEQVGACLETLRTRSEERLAHEEDAITEAVLAALGKLLAPALATREGVAAAVRAVCQQIGARDALLVRLAPCDHELLVGEPGLLGPLAERVRLEPDPSLELGGCIVESASGSLDGRLEVQLEKLRETLRRARSEAEGSS